MAFFSLAMRVLVLVSLLSLNSLNEVITVHGDVGTATSYGPPYTPTKCYGGSEDEFPPDNMFVAVSSGLWDNGAACGRMYKMRCLSGANRPCKGATIQVQVVDQCSHDPCPANLVLSRDAFSAISRPSGAKINVEFIQI